MKIFDITDYGAIGDGRFDNAEVIQKAIDDCSIFGGGIVNVPGNNVFMTGPFDLKSYVTLNLESNSKIIANSDESVYKKSAFRDNYGEGSIWIGGENAEKVTIEGNGIIDGNGIAFMGLERKASYELKPFDEFDRRPHLFTPVNFKNLVIKDITLKNSAYWCIHLVGCNDVIIDSIKIENDLKIRNSDGIDIDHSANVIISNCFIKSGDDCICFKTRREYDEFGPTENISISNCIMTSTSCSIKFGSENVDAIRKVNISDCIIKASNRGVGIQNRDEGIIEDIIIENVFIEGRLFDDVWWGKAEPIYITAYRRSSSNDKDSKIRFSKNQTEGRVGEVRNISFSNIQCKSENGIYIGGDEGKISDIHFNDISIEINKTTKHQGGKYDLRPSNTIGLLQTDISGFHIDSASLITIKNCSFKWGKNKMEYFKNGISAYRTSDMQIENFKSDENESKSQPFEFVECKKVICK